MHEPDLYSGIAFLFQLYNKKTVGKIIGAGLYDGFCYPLKIDDFCLFMKYLYNGNFLTKHEIRKIGREGFSRYNHNLLIRKCFYDLYYEGKFGNEEIIYCREEKNLEWEKAGYSFRLPENTARLVDIGIQMNICVDIFYREKALDKDCIIVYVVKNGVYKLCIAVVLDSEGRFRLIQRSAFSSNEPKGVLLEILNSWCLAKSIIIESNRYYFYYNFKV